MVETLLGNTRCAGLFTETQIQALCIDTPLIMRDPVTERFKLTIGISKSTDLLKWTKFAFTSPGTTLNSEGKLEFEFKVPDTAAFFRLEVR